MRYVLFISDIHAGSTVAMLPYNMKSYDGVEIRPSKGQKWLSRIWEKYIGAVKEIVGKNDLITVFNGDLVDGNHHGTLQLITTDETMQVRMASDIIEPVVNMSQKVIFVRGTPSHAGQEGRWDDLVARNFDPERFGTDRYSHWHVKFDVDGVVFDVAHFSTQSSIMRNSANSINQLASSIVLHYFENGQKPPDVAIRSHRHIYRSSGDNFRTEAIQTPAWQLATSYTKGGKYPNLLADIGLVLFRCDNGKYDKIVMKTKPSPSPIRKI